MAIHPTINEKTNLEQLIPLVLAHGADVMVVDDGSTDGTQAWIKSHPAYNQRLFLIARPSKMGLGTAYVEAFNWAMQRGYEIMVQMDADLSHRPEDLPIVIAPVASGAADLVIGSRYIGGVRVLNWPLRRLFLSVLAMKYTQLCLGWKLQDTTGGFKAIHARVFDRIQLQGIRSNGYVFQVEVNYRAYLAGLRIQEVPIVFVERRVGSSKMNYRIIFEALFRVLQLRLIAIFKGKNSGLVKRAANDMPKGSTSSPSAAPGSAPTTSLQKND